MLSAVLPSRHSYPAVLRQQPAHQRLVHSGPLVLGAAPRNLLTPTADRDRHCCYSHDLCMRDRSFLPASARRHADRTVSSTYSVVWRTVSEDSRRLNSLIQSLLRYL